MKYEIRSITDWLRASASGAQTQRTPETMFVAATDFEADYFGERIEITAGCSRLAPEHDLVRRFPERFTEITIGHGQPRVRDVVQMGRTGAPEIGATSRDDDYFTTPLDREGTGEPPPPAPSDEPGRPPTVPIVEPSGGRLRVTLTARASQQLREAARVATDHKEWGGWLLGRRVRGWEPIVVEKVVGAGPNAKRYTNSMTLPIDDGWRASFEGGSLEAIGMWHTHSNDLGPSEADVVLSRDELRDIESDRFGSYHVGLIAEVDDTASAWWRPQLKAFITRRDDLFGRVVCERADVSEL